MKRIKMLFQKMWRKPQAIAPTETVNESARAKERSKAVFKEAMAFATEFSHRLLIKHPLTGALAHENMNKVLLVGCVKAFFLHLALLRLNATEKQGKNIKFIKAFKEYLKTSFYEEFSQMKNMSEEMAIGGQGEVVSFDVSHHKNLLDLYARRALVSVKGERTAMNILAESLAHYFYKEQAQSALLAYINKRAKIEGVRFLSRV